jgi:cytoskeleton protein RodZ
MFPSSPGAILRSARENAGVHLAVLSSNIKVSVKQLEALEADQFDQLLEPVFARALAAKVCRFLKIDSEPVLALMPQMSNGLKPLHLIESDNKSSFNLQHFDQLSTSFLNGRKLWIFLVVLGILVWAFSADLQREIANLSAKPEVAEVVPMMPPVQEQVAPEAAQSDLPKALVFDSSTPSADTNRLHNTTDANPPIQEVKK